MSPTSLATSILSVNVKRQVSFFTFSILARLWLSRYFVSFFINFPNGQTWWRWDVLLLPGLGSASPLPPPSFSLGCLITTGRRTHTCFGVCVPCSKERVFRVAWKEEGEGGSWVVLSLWPCVSGSDLDDDLRRPCAFLFPNPFRPQTPDRGNTTTRRRRMKWFF
jgi:hypothetical protein